MDKQSVKLSIRWKLMTTMMCIMVIVLVILTYIQIANQKQIFENELELRVELIQEKLVSRGKILSANLARQVNHDLATANLSRISEVLNKTVDDDKELYFAMLIDSSSRVYIHTLKPELELEILASHKIQQQQGQKQSPNSEYDGSSVLEFISPIQISTKPWGELHIGLTLAGLNQELSNFQQENAAKINTMIKRSIYIAGLIVLITAIIILIVADRLSRPLRRLTAAVNKVASGDFTIADSVEVNSKDEIGVLASAFIAMSKDLKSSYLELRNNNVTLEEKVKERTLELAKARDDAIQANQSKSDFLSMISHEIRTPMNVIIGMTQLTFKTDLNHKQREYLTKAKLSAESLMMIINDLLDMSKIEAGQLLIEQGDFNLKDVLDTLNSLVEIQADEKNLMLNVFIAPDVPLHLEGDSLRVGQILLNLVSNAIKFTESGGIIILIELDHSSPQNGAVLKLKFSVQDTGIGLSQDQIEGLFEPFTQADISTSRVYGGTGLGLAICKRLVELMEGTIEVESKLGVGSTFSFTLALKQTDLGKLSSTAIENSENITCNDITTSGGKILVVDDYDINQQVTKAMLENEGFEVLLADSGIQAIKMVKENDIDAILMDLQMPGMDGFETARVIHADISFVNIPIIALTAHAREGVKEKCIAHGMVACISKPMDIKQLLTVLASFINTNIGDQQLVFNNKQIKSETSGNLSELISGLDLKKGLQNVAGDGKVYCQLLFDFEQQFSDSLLRINTSLQDEEKVLAEQLTHGLKGVAANIAAFELSSRVAELNSAIKNKQQNLKPLMENCELAMLQVLADIKVMVSSFQGQTEDIEQAVKPDIDLAKKYLSQLYELLKLNMLDAELCFDQLKQSLAGSDYEVEIDKLGTAINCYDYKKALRVTQQLFQFLPSVTIDHRVKAYQSKNKSKLLIVDDEPINIKVLAQALRDQYVIQIANHANEASFIAVTYPLPDLILLDVNMPGISGYELCAKIKENTITKSIPVIFITGRTEAVDETIGLRMGAVDYIAKPFNISVVKARVHTHMELKRQRDLLDKLAHIDGLTGIPNRRKFDEVLEQEWLRAQRSKKPLAIIFIDVDYFKKFNDVHGHSVGDQCLSIIANALKDCIKRKSDFIARYGGEEFVTILPGTDAKFALTVAETMREKIESLNISLIPAQGFHSVTISAGFAAIVPKIGMDASILVNAADKAVYTAKFGGRNQVQEMLLDSEC